MPWDYEPVKKTYSIDSLESVPTANIGEVKTPQIKAKLCSNCGYDFNQFLQTGYLGCSHCYKYFKNDLEHYLDEYR